MKSMFESEISEVRSDMTEVKAAIEKINENMDVIKRLLSVQAKPSV